VNLLIKSYVGYEYDLLLAQHYDLYHNKLITIFIIFIGKLQQQQKNNFPKNRKYDTIIYSYK
jgi:hypothetical protein